MSIPVGQPDEARQWAAMHHRERMRADGLRVEVERLREAVERAREICVDAAEMQCECEGYYTCNGCERTIADRAADAAEVLASVMTHQSHSDRETESGGEPS